MEPGYDHTMGNVMANMQAWEEIASRAGYDKTNRPPDDWTPRLSCRFCIFAPRAALILSGKHNPELLDKYVAVEKEIGHSFRVNLPLADIQKAIETGEETKLSDLHDKWNM